MRSSICCTDTSESGSSIPNRDASASSSRSISGRRSEGVGSRSVTSLAVSVGSCSRQFGVDNAVVSLPIFVFIQRNGSYTTPVQPSKLSNSGATCRSTRNLLASSRLREMPGPGILRVSVRLYDSNVTYSVDCGLITVEMQQLWAECAQTEQGVLLPDVGRVAVHRIAAIIGAPWTTDRANLRSPTTRDISPVCLRSNAISEA